MTIQSLRFRISGAMHRISKQSFGRFEHGSFFMMSDLCKSKMATDIQKPLALSGAVRRHNREHPCGATCWVLQSRGPAGSCKKVAKPQMFSNTIYPT